MKLVYHLIAALVGLATAGLIVFLVFGAASEQGARQEGPAPVAASTPGVCGAISLAAASSAESRAAATAALPAMFDPTGPVPAIDDPAQEQWFARVHAASGLCADEIGFVETGVARITMSVVAPVTDAQASAYAAAVLAAAFTPPFNPRSVRIDVTTPSGELTATVSARSWQAFEVARTQLRQPLTMMALAQFRQARYRESDLTVRGW